MQALDVQRGDAPGARYQEAQPGLALRLWGCTIGAAALPRDKGQTREEFAASHPVRQRIVAEVRRRPGIRLHELADAVGQTASSLKWHIQVLVKARLVVFQVVGKARFYTPPNLLPDAVRLAGLSSGLRQYRRGDALAYLCTTTTATAGDAAAHLQVSVAAARNALDRLTEEGLAVRQRPGLAAIYEATPLGRRVASLA